MEGITRSGQEKGKDNGQKPVTGHATSARELNETVIVILETWWAT
jgi:hypothetical protein